MPENRYKSIVVGWFDTFSFQSENGILQYHTLNAYVYAKVNTVISTSFCLWGFWLGSVQAGAIYSLILNDHYTSSLISFPCLTFESNTGWGHACLPPRLPASSLNLEDGGLVIFIVLLDFRGGGGNFDRPAYSSYTSEAWLHRLMLQIHTSRYINCTMDASF